MKFNLDAPEFNDEGTTLVSPDALDQDVVEEAAIAADPALREKTIRTQQHRKSFLELLTNHGSGYQMLDEDFVRARLRRFVNMRPELEAEVIAQTPMIVHTAKRIFKHLADQLPGGNRKYVIDSSLISHLTFPHEGRTFAPLGDPNDNEKIPAFFTFAGQFIDHDLTLNPINLFDDQSGRVKNEASAFIDLDSVYNRDSMLAHLFPDNQDDGVDHVFNPDGTFQLNSLGVNAFDLMRDNSPGENQNKPYIFDLRNDENQIILQIHILLMRVHNKLVTDFGLTKEEAQLEVQRNWQSFVINDYLPVVVSEEPRNWVLDRLDNWLAHHPHAGIWHELKHKPDRNGLLRIPHEFSIGFRMGHSQLRDKYHLNPAFPPIPLFDNRSADPSLDLRGSKPLVPSHVIDWPFFSAPDVLSNKIDSHVTAVVFDLPQSTIPDMVKQVGNLPQRNLIRSSQVDLAAAEDLVELYGIQAQQLTPAQIENDPEKRKLFQLDENGVYDAAHPFRTPLWYYILKEAEYVHCGGQLGPLGGRIITEVIAGGIYFNTASYVHDPAWASKIPKSDGTARTNNPADRKILFSDLVAFVTE